MSHAPASVFCCCIISIECTQLLSAFCNCILSTPNGANKLLCARKVKLTQFACCSNVNTVAWSWQRARQLLKLKRKAPKATGEVKAHTRRHARTQTHTHIYVYLHVQCTHSTVDMRRAASREHCFQHFFLTSCYQLNWNSIPKRIQLDFAIGSAYWVCALLSSQ